MFREDSLKVMIYCTFIQCIDDIKGCDSGVTNGPRCRNKALPDCFHVQNTLLH